MSKKKKSKKQKKPNIPVQTMALPRLQMLLNLRQQGELDNEEFVASIEALMTEIGREAILNALIGLLDQSSNEQKDALMTAISQLGDAQAIDHLWYVVRRSKMSVGAKMTALVILQQMGEEVNLEDPGEYFTWRDIKQGDIKEVADLARFATRALIKELQQSKNIDDVEVMMMRFTSITAQAGGEETELMQIETLIDMGDTGAADMLTAIVATTPYSRVRQAARQGLLKLAGQNTFPQNEIIKSLTQERLYAAYSTDPAHPWQQGVILAFERGQNSLQAMVFLRDFGHPWQGAIKDMFVTHSMTPHEFARNFLRQIGRVGEDAEYRQVTYQRARQFLVEAIAANKQHRVKLPPEYHEFLHLIERRITDPSKETLAYADQVDAKTVDEWGELKGQPIRGLSIIGPDGEAMPVMVFGEPDEDFWEEAEYTLEDLIAEVDDYYEMEYKEETEDEDAADPILPQDWVTGYLTAAHHKGIDVEELEDQWDYLSDFIFYLEDEEVVDSLADN